MRDIPSVEGSWPGRLVFRRGWARAEARPWSDSWPGSQVRVVRGNHQFLATVCEHLAGLDATPVHSPAIFASATPMWRRAGFEEYESLLVLERALHGGAQTSDERVRVVSEPPWDEIVSIDDAAFDGLWRMGRMGLEEALASTRKGVVLVAGPPGAIDGFAIVGAEHGYSYLQRLAVRPEARGRGLGTALVRAAMGWAARAGGHLMVLNTQHDALPARRLYARLGFTETGSLLRVMRWAGPY
ncbi:MAG TPA: GNAT family N-acetyltransferase [Acidimicrobiia bacterium]|nr:GNAT family N-acetyltransferase [Acidimicrobiia bacterium]